MGVIVATCEGTQGSERVFGVLIPLVIVGGLVFLTLPISGGCLD